MAIKMEVKLNEKQVEELFRPVSLIELNELGITFEEYSENRRERIVRQLAIESGFHPAGYGMWSINISKKGDNYYAVWYRGETCD